MTEFVTFGETGLRLAAPRGERLESVDRLRVRAAGPESNAAVAARRMGCDATWISRLPDSPLGQRVAGELRGYDLEVLVEWIDTGTGLDVDSRLGLTFTERAGQPRGNALGNDHEGVARAGVSMDDVPVARVEAADAAYTTGATPALSPRAATATARFLKAASDGGATTAFGLSYQADRWDGPADARRTLTEFFPAVDVLVTSDDDARKVLDADGQPAAAAHSLAAEYALETIVLVHEGGATAYHDTTVHEVDGIAADAHDRRGATAAFAGAFLTELVEGTPLDDAVRTGLAADALTRTISGAVPTITREEVDRVLADAGDH
jgi:2-dehydro-3-deoxygluconokinase